MNFLSVEEDVCPLSLLEINVMVDFFILPSQPFYFLSSQGFEAIAKRKYFDVDSSALI